MGINTHICSYTEIIKCRMSDFSMFSLHCTAVALEFSFATVYESPVIIQSNGNIH